MIKKLFAMALLLVPCGPAIAKDKLFKVVQYSFVASNVFDFTTSARLGNDKYREANPIMPDHPRCQAIVMGNLGAVSLWSTHKLYKSGRKKTAIISLLAGIGLHIWAGTHNLRLGD